MVNSAKVLTQLFGDNRAEWPSSHFKQLFVEPTYISKLEAKRPTVLIGGRGTGKSTALHSLKYEETYTRLEAQGKGFSDQTFFGVLIRMNKNRVKVFDGANIPNERWSKIFVHYFNLLVCQELTKLAIWLQEKLGIELTATQVESISIDLTLKPAASLCELATSIKRATSELQIFVNNPESEQCPRLSMAESPLRTFVESLESAELLDGQTVFCCIDEYENLYDYQQAALNTYVKHAEPPLSYKIGVRKKGFRNRQTIDGQDLLKVPDDYAEIEIVDEGFDYFSKAVGELRLTCAQELGVKVPSKLTDFLVDISFAEEVIALGGGKVAQKVRDELSLRDGNYAGLIAKPDHEVYFLRYWADVSGETLYDLADDWLANEISWKTRLENHGFASLFWLSRGNKGQRIKKFYAGESTLTILASGNIRYFLELIDTAIKKELDGKADFAGKQIKISAKAQTLAAKEVGQRRLNQLEGLADNGVELKRLVLGIGKVFFEYARTPEGRAPETNSFLVKGSTDEVSKVKKLLSEGVAHLAFEEQPATKATSSAEMRESEYRLHKIFSAFFEMSYRAKRRTNFNANDLLEVLGARPSSAIARMIGKPSKNEKSTTQKELSVTKIQELPDQLALFSEFYGENS
ncbi:ORC-CDC6 family AAA ATPase [Alteromonas macleodii]|uniref:ORC-CDC6 family AAA ATPase n=1 Tax=Alteromonas macleodii TaxID=28108 RepID=UPI00066BA25B|nr:hypothetical protein [Alteromonas macleodii]CAI3929041.1 hypothetical protein MIT1002_00358 [Alteromonas macleodii]VTP50348.1 hypothetical protein MIT1002_00358 [Alteromonas macleodii]